MNFVINNHNVKARYEVFVNSNNFGGAMNLTSGIFTASRKGLYSFTFTGVVQSTTSSYFSLTIHLMWNNSIIGTGLVKNYGDGFGTLSIESTINLKMNDKVWVQITGKSNSYLFDDNTNHYTHFTGQLLQEDLPQSLSF